MDYFFIDIKNNDYIKWDDLICDLKKTNEYNPYCKTEKYYEIFKNIIFSMLCDKEIILLDSDFSNDELMKLTGYTQFSSFNESLSNLNFIFNNKIELIERLKKTNSNWKITLFTSGTTGLPKKITHNLKSITRFVKISKQNQTNIWGFAYNPTHMAGLQVFFQALLNGNKIIRLFGLSQEEIKNELKKNIITNISATPTFYKLLLPCEDIFSSILRLSSGGEKFNESTILHIAKIFPNAKISNIYASTEAGTLFASDNEYFTIKPEFEKYIQIENNELYIHKNLLGDSDLNIIDWYRTGDLIEIVDQKPLKFRVISRKNEMINIGGYKVNPSEVEEVILSFAGVKSAYVYSKSNSVLGNILCCDIICDNKNINELLIRSYLQTKIQEYKIPRIFKFVTEISITRTGKIKRI